MENRKKINFGIVGCGRISKQHIEAIKSFADTAQIVGLCDIDLRAIENAHKLTDAKIVSQDLETFFRNTEIDVVSLCTPSGLHSEQAILASRFGKHVITEKPMATNLRDGIAMVEACEAAGVNLYVVKQNRLNPTTVALKQALEQNRFGKIYSIICNVLWARPQSYYDQAPWRGLWKMDGGAFMNQASHYVDLMVHLFGPVERVFSMTATMARKIEAEDSGSALIRWKSGAIGTVNVTMLCPEKNYEGSITIVGEKGLVRLGGLAANKILNWDFLEKKESDAKIIEDSSYNITSVYGNSHQPYYGNVIENLNGRRSVDVNGREGLKSLALLEGIYQSARTGEQIWI